MISARGIDWARRWMARGRRKKKRACKRHCLQLGTCRRRKSWSSSARRAGRAIRPPCQPMPSLGIRPCPIKAMRSPSDLVRGMDRSWCDLENPSRGPFRARKMNWPNGPKCDVVSVALRRPHCCAIRSEPKASCCGAKVALWAARRYAGCIYAQASQYPPRHWCWAA